MRFDDVAEEFTNYVQEIVYATLVTVDKRNRPRARVLLPIWQVVDGRPVGWVAVYRTPVKTAHLARNPHVTVAYWKPSQNAAFVDAVAGWVTEPAVLAEVWDLYRKGSPAGVGYDPGRYWRGPADPEFAVLRLEPFRVQVVRGRDLRSRIWKA
jgi:hypothetical protein